MSKDTKFGSGLAPDPDQSDQRGTSAGRSYNGETPSRRRHPDPVYTVDDAIEKLGFGPFQVILFFLCGFLWLADAMELMILSILSPAVKCQWSLSSVEEAIITSVVFLGALIGSLCWGVFGDTFGRKSVLILSDFAVCLSGVLSALKLTPNDDRLPGYPWLLLCRFGVGFGAAGITQVSTYFIEYLPQKTRAVCTVFVSSWWGVGTMFGAALAVGVMGNESYGWHWYLGLSAIPSAVVLLFIFFVPESARYYVGRGKFEEAERVLKRVAWVNMRSLPDGHLVSHEVKLKHQASKYHKKPQDDSSKKNEVANDLTSEDEDDGGDEKKPLLLSIDEKCSTTSKGSLGEMVKSRIGEVFSKFPLLFRNNLWKSTGILAFLWFGAAWIYYGVVLLTSTILQSNPHCGTIKYNDTNDNFTNGSTGNFTFCEETGLDTQDYLRIMWTTGAEMPGLLVTLVIIEIVGRKLTMAFNFTMILIGFCLLYLCTNEILLTFFLFIIRGFSTGLFQTMYVYTPEVYPTQVRGIGIGVLYAVARVGAISTPYVAQVLFETSDYAAISVYAGSALVLVFLSLLLPLETKGKSLEK